MKLTIIAGICLALLSLIAFGFEGDDDAIRKPNIINYASIPIGHDIVHGTNDGDWWKLVNYPPGPMSIWIEPGVGFLCGCPKGSPFAPYVEIYDNTLTLLAVYQASTPGPFLINFTSPISAPLRIWISGSPIGPEHWSEYNVAIY